MILQYVRWYVAYSLSYRDLEELVHERDNEVDHSTIQRWVVYLGTTHREGLPIDKQGTTVECSTNSKARYEAFQALFDQGHWFQRQASLINIAKGGANTAGIKQFDRDENRLGIRLESGK